MIPVLLCCCAADLWTHPHWVWMMTTMTMVAGGLVRLTSPPVTLSLLLSPRCESGGSPRCVPHLGPPQHRSDTDTDSTQA